MTKGQNKKPPSKNNDGGKTKGKGLDTDSNKDNSGNLLSGAHTNDDAKNASSTKSTSKSTPSNTILMTTPSILKIVHRRWQDFMHTKRKIVLMVRKFPQLLMTILFMKRRLTRKQHD